MWKSWSPGKWGRWWVGMVVAGVLGLPIAWAAPGPDDAAADPDQPGIRFTPGMARSFASVYAKQVLQKRYDLPEEKTADAEEKVARRLMQMAHKIDEPGRELIERFMEEQLTAQADGNQGGFVPPGFGKEFADRVLPILPEIREMARGVSQDVRPMLPMKKQLQMAGEMMAFKTGVDAFENTMQKWASGEVTDYEDPFRQPRKLKKDENGETEDLKQARDRANKEVEKSRAGKDWARYVEQMQKLYNFDAAQTATAQSILREYTEREERLMADPSWRDLNYRGKLWQNLSQQLPNSWMHPLRTLVEDQQAEARLSWNDLEEQFKARLESVPTTAQRRAAAEKVEALLQEKKLKPAETQP